MRITDLEVGEAMKDTKSWREAATEIVAFFIEKGRCFSSGELTAALRIHTPFIFSNLTVGEFLKNRFWGGDLPSYEDGQNPAQVSRFTEGRYPERTPENTEVFVYGPDTPSCEEHDFEVFVPQPGETMADAPIPKDKSTLHVVSSSSPTGKSQYNAQGHTFGILATVWNSGKMTIPRVAFERLCQVSGRTLRIGDPVYVTVTPEKVELSLEEPITKVGVQQYSLVKDRGRISFRAGASKKPFEPGARYHVEFQGESITLDLTSPV